MDKDKAKEFFKSAMSSAGKGPYNTSHQMTKK